MSGESYEFGGTLDGVYAELRQSMGEEAWKSQELGLAYTALCTSGNVFRSMHRTGFRRPASWLEDDGDPSLVDQIAAILRGGVPLLDPNGGLTFNSTSLLVEKAQPDTSFDPKGVVRRREMEVIFESNMCDGFDGLVFLDVYLILKSGMRAVATRAKDIFDAAYGRHHVEDEAILEANRACDTEKNKVLDRLVRNAQSGQLLAGMLLSLEQAVGEQLPFKKVYEQGFQLPDFRKNPRHVINYIPSGLQ